MKKAGKWVSTVRFFFSLTLYFGLTFLLGMIRNTVNPLLSSLGGLFISNRFERGFNRDGGLIGEGGGGLI